MQSKWNIPSATQQSYTFIPSFALQGSMEHQKECQIVSLYQVRISYIQILDFLFNRHGYGRNTAGESAAVGFSRILLTRDLQILGVKFFPVPLFPVSFIPGLVKERKSHLWNSFMQKFYAIFVCCILPSSGDQAKTMSEHGAELCASVTRLLVSAKAVFPGEGIGQINGSMGGLFENTMNYKIRCYLIKKLKEFF